jgi:hypothetical protein
VPDAVEITAGMAEALEPEAPLDALAEGASAPTREVDTPATL